MAKTAFSALALSLLSGSGYAQQTAAPAPADKSSKHEAQLAAALSRLEAQETLTAADHTALKKAAQALRVETLRVCGDPGNMPLSNIKGEGYQNKIMDLVASSMGAGVSYFWRPYLSRGMTRQTLDTADCDLLLDIPAGGDRILATTPIFRTTFVFASHSDRKIEIKSLDDSQLKSLTIGVYQTSALRTALRSHGIQENVRIHVLSHDADLVEENQPWHQVKQVVDGKLDLAGVWGPFAGWLKSRGAPIDITPVNLMDDEMPLEFDLSIGMKKTDYIMMYKLDLALEENKAEIEKLLRSFGVPLVQCSRCVVAGELPAHGVYNKVLAEPTPVDETKISPDQKVTRERLEAWLQAGADVNQELANAVLASDVARIRFLIEKGADVNKRDAQGYGALHSAARHRKSEIAKVLLDLKADPNTADRDGMSVMMHAVMRDDPVMIKLLAEHRAKLNEPDTAGATPLGQAIVEDRYKAAMALIEAGAAVDMPNSAARLTPLMIAAGKEGRRLTLAAGIDRIEKLNPHDPGALEIVRALISKSANVNAVSATGLTALILAAAHNNAPIAGLLVQSGADVNVKTPEGKSAIDIARANGNTNVVSLLKLMEQAGGN